jgi:hypothetical protein
VTKGRARNSFYDASRGTRNPQSAAAVGRTFVDRLPHKALFSSTYPISRDLSTVNRTRRVGGRRRWFKKKMAQEKNSAPGAFGMGYQAPGAKKQSSTG